MLTSVEVVLRQHPGWSSGTSVGKKVSFYVGPSTTLTLHDACAMGSLKLLDLMWEASCTSADKRSADWSINNFLRSELHYYRWEFMESVTVAAGRGDLAMVQWLFDHFSCCEASEDAFKAAATNGHVPAVEFLLANSGNRPSGGDGGANKRKISAGGDKASSQSVPAEDEGGKNTVHWRDYVVSHDS